MNSNRIMIEIAQGRMAPLTRQFVGLVLATDIVEAYRDLRNEGHTVHQSGKGFSRSILNLGWEKMVQHMQDHGRSDLGDLLNEALEEIEDAYQRLGGYRHERDTTRTL